MRFKTLSVVILTALSIVANARADQGRSDDEMVALADVARTLARCELGPLNPALRETLHCSSDETAHALLEDAARMIEADVPPDRVQQSIDRALVLVDAALVRSNALEGFTGNDERSLLVRYERCESAAWAAQLKAAASVRTVGDDGGRKGGDFDAFDELIDLAIQEYTCALHAIESDANVAEWNEVARAVRALQIRKNIVQLNQAKQEARKKPEPQDGDKGQGEPRPAPAKVPEGGMSREAERAVMQSLLEGDQGRPTPSKMLVPNPEPAGVERQEGYNPGNL